MKNPNRTAIRRQLPHGTLTQIADNLGLTTRTVSEYFVHGWHRENEPAILEQAVSIIESQRPSEELGERIEDLGLTGAVAIPKKRKKQADSSPAVKIPWPLILITIAIGLFLFVPSIKTYVTNLWNQLFKSK